MDLHERLPPRPSSVGAARRLVRSAGQEVVPDDLVETAELLVSEVVSNAVVHAGTPIDLEVSVDDGEVLVRVRDGSPQRPVLRRYGESAATGRGLRLVDDLADDWGVSPGEHGKSVWFRLGSEGAPARPGTPEQPEAAAGVSECVRVALVDVPLFLHAAWQRKAAALLREDLLITFEDEDEESFEEVVRHAECSSAMGLLSDAIPEPEGASESEGLDGACSDSGEECFRTVVMEVPADAVKHFRTLDETLDRAVGLADSDALLAAPTDSRTRRFRRWVCRQVSVQAAGLPPEAWPSA